MQINQGPQFKGNLSVNMELIEVMISLKPVSDFSSLFTPDCGNECLKYNIWMKSRTVGSLTKNFTVCVCFMLDYQAYTVFISNLSTVF